MCVCVCERERERERDSKQISRFSAVDKDHQMYLPLIAYNCLSQKQSNGFSIIDEDQRMCVCVYVCVRACVV